MTMNTDMAITLPPQGHRNPRGSAGRGGIVPAPPSSRGHCGPEPSDGRPAPSPASDAGEYAIAEEWRVIAALVGRLLRLTEAREERLRGNLKPRTCPCPCYCQRAEGREEPPEPSDSGVSSPEIRKENACIPVPRPNPPQRKSTCVTETQGRDKKEDHRFTWSMVVTRGAKHPYMKKEGPVKGPLVRKRKGVKRSLSHPLSTKERRRKDNPPRDRGTLASPHGAEGGPGNPPDRDKRRRKDDPPAKQGAPPATPVAEGDLDAPPIEEDKVENPPRDRGTPSSPRKEGGGPKDPKEEELERRGRHRGGPGTPTSPHATAGGEPGDPTGSRKKKEREEGWKDPSRVNCPTPPKAGHGTGVPTRTQLKEEDDDEVDVGEELPPPKYTKREADVSLRCGRCAVLGHSTEDCIVTKRVLRGLCRSCWCLLEGHSRDLCKKYPFCHACWRRMGYPENGKSLSAACHVPGGGDCSPCPPRWRGGPMVFSPDASSAEESGGDAADDEEESGCARSRGGVCPSTPRRGSVGGPPPRAAPRGRVPAPPPCEEIR